MNQNEFRDCFGKRKGTAKLARVLSRLRSVRGNNESVRQGLQDEKTGSLDSGMTTLPPKDFHGSGIERGADSASITMS
ncbi:hypothetical protein H4Q26_002054 [Puccinia striiformis f. sp. tritici PST-130]|nr:hypothetical protein H4Q26_002054 [Puccinia striiformis f. sp. tritici PST-130]